MLCTPKPNGFADHYPYEMAISLGIYPTFSDKAMFLKSFDGYFSRVELAFSFCQKFHGNVDVENTSTVIETWDGRS